MNSELKSVTALVLGCMCRPSTSVHTQVQGGQRESWLSRRLGQGRPLS